SRTLADSGRSKARGAQVSTGRSRSMASISGDIVDGSGGDVADLIGTPPCPPRFCEPGLNVSPNCRIGTTGILIMTAPTREVCHDRKLPLLSRLAGAGGAGDHCGRRQAGAERR